VLRFPVDLGARGEWRVCLQYDLLTSASARPPLTTCPLRTPVVDRAERLRRRWHRTVARVTAADPRLQNAYAQSVEDFAALRLYDHDFSPDVWLPAAGLPWFVAVFGRDSAIASLQALPVHPLFAVGTLQKLGAWQATADDPVRDSEPGKICHEMRVGEWAHFGTIPHSPYFGTADATPLYVMLLAETYRWLGDPELLYSFRSVAERCLDWIDQHGDRDGDGLQEYAPRAPGGYRNQCWRDAEDGVLDESGSFPPHPIGTCEMQAYVYRAKLDVADLFAAWGDAARAERLRREARELRARFLDAYWMSEEGALAFALDGTKRQVATVTSNPGHCLAMGILDMPRAQQVADRLLQPDLFSGWGLRTLSTDHPAYDPHSYQRGSVWPHDTMLAAAGLRRYGRLHDCWQLVEGLLAASAALPRHQMPELFAGLPRESRDAPVPYARANVPQAWAAGVAFHAVRVLLGLEPDVPAGRLYLDPALPPWCPTLDVENVRVGAHRIRIHAARGADGITRADVQWRDGGGLDVVRGRPPWLNADVD
jgi:glycogen debranching enzyme